MAGNGLKQNLIRTLVGTGFTLLPSASSKTNYFTVMVERHDLFGVRVKYLIALCENTFEVADLDSLVANAEYHEAALILIGDADAIPDSASMFTYEQFVDRLGGEIMSLLPREPEYAKRLKILGDFKLPKGMQGEPDKLFESYVHAGLQFLFRARVIKHGDEQLFKSVPDGIVFSAGAPLLLYDAKSAGGGYTMSANAERQFITYIQRFNRRYQTMFGPLTAFLVIAGKFSDSDESLVNRSRAVQAEAHIPLCFMDAENFGQIVKMMSAEPLFRKTIAWNWVFTNPIVKASDVRRSLQDVRRDKVVLA